MGLLLDRLDIAAIELVSKAVYPVEGCHVLAMFENAARFAQAEVVGIPKHHTDLGFSGFALA